MISRYRTTSALLTAMLLTFSGALAHADIYRYQDENGVWHFTNINSDRRYQLYIRVRDEDPSVFIEKYDSIIEQASDTFGIDSSLVKAVINAESGFDHKATSSKGAQGLMQLMPKTATDMQVKDPYEPEQNIFGGVRYLGDLLERYNDNMELALAAYNAGPENVEAYNGVPPFPETETFIKRVLDYYNKYKKTGTD
jgi:soluble lytic murein transglycosylase-like protein